MIQSPDYCLINGISSNKIDIYVDTPSVPTMARQRYTTYQTGADEDSTSPDNTFENINYSLIFYTFNRENFDNTDIYSYFAKAETLQISRLPDYYFKVREIYIDTPENVFRGKKIRYTANFVLAPFKYLIDNPEIALTNDSVIKNRGTRYSRPIFKINGSGDIKLIVNGENFEIKNISDNTIVDSQRYITYSGNNLFHNRTNGKYPFLAVGDNVVSWEGNISSMKIIRNERCY